jgi:hypothetical protein
VYFGDGGKYIRLFIINFVNNSVAARHEPECSFLPLELSTKSVGADEGINCLG